MDANPLPSPGDKIWVRWGKFGDILAFVTNVSPGGIVYAKRWDHSRQRWTTPRRLYPWRGMFAIEQFLEARE